MTTAGHSPRTSKISASRQVKLQTRVQPPEMPAMWQACHPHPDGHGRL